MMMMMMMIKFVIVEFCYSIMGYCLNLAPPSCTSISYSRPTSWSLANALSERLHSVALI